MKIHQLPQGTRFEYEGESYVKTGPLCATGKLGQKLIPRYAVLKVLGDVPQPPEPSTNALSRKAVQDAFEHFYARCESIVLPENLPELKAAREEFMESIGPLPRSQGCS